jgi:hypothetical protein
MRIFYATALALLSMGICLPTTAEVLEMPGQSTGMAEPGVTEMPLRGMHMDQVREAYGEPQEIMPPVGDPPISRWLYDGYTVYFEYSYVIQSVPSR